MESALWLTIALLIATTGVDISEINETVEVQEAEKEVNNSIKSKNIEEYQKNTSKKGRHDGLTLSPKQRTYGSWVDFYFGGTKYAVADGQSLIGNGVNISVQFIGIRDGTPVALISFNDESEILTRKDEQYFSDGYIFVSEVYYTS